MNTISVIKSIAINQAKSKAESEDDRLVQKIIQNKLGKQTQQSEQPDLTDHPARITSSADPGDGEDAAESPVIEMTEAQFAAILNGQIGQVSAKYDQDLAAAKELLVNQKAESDKKEKELQAQLEKQQNLAAVLQRHNVSMSAIAGGVTPQQAAISMSENRGGIHRDDAAKELQRIYDKSPAYEVAIDQQMFQQMDNRELESFILDNRKAALHGLENLVKQAGLLRGSTPTPVVKQAGTTTGDLSPFLLHTLSTFMRMTTINKYNWRQFVATTTFTGKNRGDAVEVPRYATLDCSDDPADYTIGRDEDISARKQPISVGSEIISLELQALGKSGLAGNTNATVSVSQFYEQTTIYDLMGILNKILYESYLKWESSAIRGEFSRTSRAYYNNGGDAAPLATSLAAGSGGQLTADYLDYIGAIMDDDGVPEYANGKYALQVGGFELLPLRKDLKQSETAFDKMALEELSAVLQPQAPNGDVSPVSGYIGDYGKFMIFSTNTVYKGAGAKTPTVIAGSSRDIYNAYAFGADCVGRAQAMPFTMIYDSATNFGMRKTISWASIETIKAIDVDPSLSLPMQAVKQQQRAYKLKLSRSKI
jgi:hypothetical protein